jgi:phosphoserine phosphatase RsbU/P
MDSAHLLIVDDNEMNRDMLSRRVQRQGFRVAMAENGRQALDLLADTPFDLLLLDIMMPEMDGYEVLERIKADRAMRHIPVIMISAIDEVENTARCIEMGADDYLTKPFNATILKARINSSLEKKRFRDQEQLYAKSLERELEIGRQIQAGFLPESLPEHPDWELAAIFEPARQVAGDFYDAFELPRENHVAFVLADVCDKGVGAALFMALFRSLIRSNAASFFAADDPVSDALIKSIVQTNDYIAETHAKANMFATLFIGVLDLVQGEMIYINAGQEPPLLLRATGEAEWIDPTGPVVGALPDMEFSIGELTLHQGDLLLGYTDGITEARNPAGDFFGEDSLKNLSAKMTAQNALNKLYDELMGFISTADQADDITLLALKYR